MPKGLILVKRKYSLTSTRRISEINLTPLTDLTFLLLTTFIITYPLLEQGIMVDLPDGSAEELSESKTRTITINKDGAIYLDNSQLSIDELKSSMGVIGQSEPDAVVMVRGDEKIVYGRIVEVLKVLYDAKITKMALVTEPEGGK